jgi:16S rRNA processing protein RimM
MQKKDCFLLGTVFKLHGYKGHVNIYNDNDISFNFTALKYFLIEINNNLIPYFIEQARTTKPNVILVKFEDVNSEEIARKIHKCNVYVPNDWLTMKLRNEINEKKIIGYSVIDNKLGDVGKVTFINTKSIQQLIYVEKDGKEFCFPMHEEFIKEIISKERVLKVNIPIEFLTLN